MSPGRRGSTFFVPIHHQRSVEKRLREIPEESFTRHWAGYATATARYTPHNCRGGPYYEFILRQGERPEESHFSCFLARPTATRSCADRRVSEALACGGILQLQSGVGWQCAGTMNLNIRYGHMTMALLAQAAIHQLRNRLGEPFARWDAKHWAKDVFRGLDGDVRVNDNTIIVTYYNAPNRELLRHQYEGLPAKLTAENVDPRVPWLYGFRLDFRFK